MQVWAQMTSTSGRRVGLLNHPVQSYSFLSLDLARKEKRESFLAALPNMAEEGWTLVYMSPGPEPVMLSHSVVFIFYG